MTKHDLPATGGPRRSGAHRSPASFVLWLAAFAIMLGAASWQRLTGPTHPRRGRVEIAGQEVRWRLPRNQISGEPLRVAIALPAGAGGDPITGSLHYRRFPTADPFAALSMSRRDGTLHGELPTQPPAGKLEYFVVLSSPQGSVRLPAGETVVMRYRGYVPPWILVPHVLVMFVAMLVGTRAAMAAVLGRGEARRTARLAFLGITLGGMILGPIVQKHAFGAYWTGWPLGHDLTDNKTGAMWIAWLAAVALLERRGVADRLARAGVVLAALVMIAVYVIPHSMRGSQLDYGTVEQGSPSGARPGPRGELVGPRGDSTAEER